MLDCCASPTLVEAWLTLLNMPLPRLIIMPIMVALGQMILVHE